MTQNIVVLALSLLLIAVSVGSCKPAEFDRDNWHSIGDGVYWRQFESEDGRECVLARKSGSGSISIDCERVPK